MGELINGRKPEEIKRNLSYLVRCENCPQNHEYGCDYDKQTEECRTVNDALALIEYLEAKVPKWISVEERLPEQYQHVIVHVQHTAKWVGATKREEQWHVVEEDCWLGDGWEVNADDDIHEVTHWMPLPEPPEVEHD